MLEINIVRKVCWLIKEFEERLRENVHFMRKAKIWCWIMLKRNGYVFFSLMFCICCIRLIVESKGHENKLILPLIVLSIEMKKHTFWTKYLLAGWRAIRMSSIFFIKINFRGEFYDDFWFYSRFFKVNSGWASIFIMKCSPAVIQLVS